MDSFKSWLGQVTTGHGFIALVGIAIAVMDGDLTWQRAAPMVAASLVALAWPENTRAQTIARDVTEKVVDDFSQVTSASRSAVLLLAGLTAVLVACTKPVPPQDVYALAASLTAADRAALGYLTLPVCGSPGVTTKICADPSIKAKIKAGAASAYAAVQAAEAGAQSGNSELMTAAGAAIAGYLALIPVAAPVTPQ